MVTEAGSRSYVSNGNLMDIKAGGNVQLFDSAKMYVFLFCVLALITVEKLRQLTLGAAHAGTTDLDIRNLLIACVTFMMAVYLPILFRKISNRIERVGIVLTEVLCLLWLANLLTKLGVAWAEIPHGLFVSAIFHCAITVLAGVRTFQVLWHRSPAQEDMTKRRGQ